MPRLPWFRVYRDIIYHPKVRRMPESQRWALIACMALCDEETGLLVVTSGLPMTVREIAQAAAIEQRLCNRAIQTALDLAFLTKVGNTLCVTNWCEWQHLGEGRRKPSDTPERVLQRVQRHRASLGNAPVTPLGNAPRNALCNAPVTPHQNRTEQINPDSLPRPLPNPQSAVADLDPDPERRATIIASIETGRWDLAEPLGFDRAVWNTMRKDYQRQQAAKGADQ